MQKQHLSRHLPEICFGTFTVVHTYVSPPMYIVQSENVLMITTLVVTPATPSVVEMYVCTTVNVPKQVSRRSRDVFFCLFVFCTTHSLIRFWQEI